MGLPRLVLATALVLGVAACGGKKKPITIPDTPGPSRPGPAAASKPATSTSGTATLTPDTEGAPSFGPVRFEFDSAVLTDDGRAELQRLAGWLEGKPAKVTVEGHADERGTTEYNIALGQRRADAIVDYLVRLGVARARLAPISYGEERPAASGDDESAWAQNRRGELRPDR